MKSRLIEDVKGSAIITFVLALAACFVVGFTSTFSFLGKFASVVGVVVLLALVGIAMKHEKKRQGEVEELERKVRALESRVATEKEKTADLLAGRTPGAFSAAWQLYSLWKNDGIESAGENFREMLSSEELRREYLDFKKRQKLADPRQVNYKQEYLDYLDILHGTYGA